MEKVNQLAQEAVKAFTSADHLAYTTYNLIQEPKLLMQIMQKLYTSLVNGMNAYLYKDYELKKITTIPITVEERIKLFEEKSARYNHIPMTIPLLIRELKNRVNYKKESIMDFTRKGKFIMAGEGFERLQVIDIVQIRSWIMQIRPFIEQIRSTLCLKQQ